MKRPKTNVLGKYMTIGEDGYRCFYASFFCYVVSLCA